MNNNSKNNSNINKLNSNTGNSSNVVMMHNNVQNSQHYLPNHQVQVSSTDCYQNSQNFSFHQHNACNGLQRLSQSNDSGSNSKNNKLNQ